MISARTALPALSAAVSAVAIGLTVHSPASAAPSTSGPSTTPSTTPSSTPTTTPTSTSAAGYGADDLGYLDSGARCDKSQSLMAYGRTTRSLVAICVTLNGELEYRGERISDGASLTMPATRSADGSVVAVNDGVTYAVSPTMLLVSEGDTVIYRDSWAEFHQPRFSAGSSAPAPATTTSGTPTVSTTTVTLAPKASS